MATNTNPFYTYSATAGSSKTLQKPQDGGDNNQWGNYINTDLDEIVAAVNALSDKIADASENTLVDFTATGSAVNHVGITNAATGNPPQISSAGSDTNVDLTLTAKGTGDINLTPGTNGDVNIPASKGITFGDDGEKIEGDGTDLTIASSNDLNLTATTDINVPANVGVTFGDDGEKIEGDGTNLTIASSATLNVNTGSASGNDLKVNTSQLVVEGDTGNIGIGITPTSKLHLVDNTGGLSATEDITSTFTRGDGTYDPQLDIRHSTSGTDIRHTYSSGASNLSFSIASSKFLNIASNGSITTPNSAEFNGTIGGTASYPSGFVRQIQVAEGEAVVQTNTSVSNALSKSITTGSQNSKVLISFSGRAYTSATNTEMKIHIGTTSGGTEIETFLTLWTTSGEIAERFFCQKLYDMAQSTTLTIYVGVQSNNSNDVYLNPNGAVNGPYVLTLQEIID